MPITVKNADGSIRMEEWVMNELYEQLLHDPLWTLATFKVKEGEVIDKTTKDIMRHLVSQQMHRVPLALYDSDYSNGWKLKTFVPVFKSAVNILSKRF